MEYLTALIPNLLPQIPNILLHVAGLWLSISRRKEHPKIFLAAAIYFGLGLLIRIGSQFYIILPIYMQDQGLSTTNIGSMYTTLNLICVPFTIIMEIALLYAIFAPRQETHHTPNTPIFAGDKNG
ncbi:MAG: hypothetical protein IPG80_04905 [Anaerolineales bacterium]|uniref:hypothetical protein n=1 Tax=Candidatus Villigracilis vicinus TaxID=3140679 RepID=UPI00313698D5|nr:hypothetical protein [Anaerolineales bacterium]